MLITNFIYFFISAIFLVASSIYLVKSLDKISKFLKISQFTAAFIIMAIATSIPELLVGISSALNANPSLSLGNVLGASIIDITLIMAIFIFLSRGIDLSSKKVGAGLYFMSFSVLFLLVLFLIGKQISRIDGVLLLGLFFINFFRMIKKKEKYSATHKDKFKRHEPILYSFLFILCLIVLFVSSNYAVKYAESISVELNIPELVVGIFLLSFATTLPELIFGINAVLLKHKEMSVGDQIGTVFTNLTLIVGIVAIIHPITTSLFPFLFSCFFLLLSCLIFVHFVNNNRNLSVTEGIHLFLLYFIFVLVQFIWLK